MHNLMAIVVPEAIPMFLITQTNKTNYFLAISLSSQKNTDFCVTFNSSLSASVGNSWQKHWIHRRTLRNQSVNRSHKLTTGNCYGLGPLLVGSCMVNAASVTNPPINDQ